MRREVARGLADDNYPAPYCDCPVGFPNHMPPFGQVSRPVERQGKLSCTTVAGEASSWMAPYHDRMPVMLTGHEIENWPTGKVGRNVLRPAAG